MQSGMRSDGVTHAVVRRWFGHRALCGAGRVRLVLPAPFRSNDLTACRECARLSQPPAE